MNQANKFYKVPVKTPVVGTKAYDLMSESSILRVTEVRTVARVRAYRPVEAHWCVEVEGNDDDVIIAWGEKENQWNVVK